jgi:hypothetical protein
LSRLGRPPEKGGLLFAEPASFSLSRSCRTRWRAFLSGDPPKRLSRQLLLRALAHAMQERVFDRLSANVRQRLRRLAAELQNTDRIASIRTQPAFKPGTRLIREWQSRTYEITVRMIRIFQRCRARLGVFAFAAAYDGGANFFLSTHRRVSR